MSPSTTVVIRPERSGYVFGCGFLLATAILWVIAQAMYAIKSQNDMIIAWIVCGEVLRGSRSERRRGGDAGLERGWQSFRWTAHPAP